MQQEKEKYFELPGGVDHGIQKCTLLEHFDSEGQELKNEFTVLEKSFDSNVFCPKNTDFKMSFPQGQKEKYFSFVIEKCVEPK